MIEATFAGRRLGELNRQYPMACGPLCVAEGAGEAPA
jgi:hypothetical protein